LCVCLSSGKCSSASQQRKKKRKKEIKETRRQMDVYSNASTWLQHSPTQVAQSSPAVQNDIADSQRPPNSNDWKDRSPSVSDSNGASTVSGSIDLHDFGLGDLSGKHRVHALMTRLPYAIPNEPDWVYPAPQTSSTSLAASSPFFNYPNNFFLSSVPSPYNAMSYGSSSWSPQPGQVPLSTYSTLNGATSANSQSSTSQPSQTNIECVPYLPLAVYALSHLLQPCLNDPQHINATAFIFPASQHSPTSIPASSTIAFSVPSIIFIIYSIHACISPPSGIQPFPNSTKSTTVTVATATGVPGHSISICTPCPPPSIRYSTIFVLYRIIAVRFSRLSIPEPARGVSQRHQILSSVEEFFRWSP